MSLLGYRPLPVLASIALFFGAGWFGQTGLAATTAKAVYIAPSTTLDTKARMMRSVSEPGPKGVKNYFAKAITNPTAGISGSLQTTRHLVAAIMVPRAARTARRVDHVQAVKARVLKAKPLKGQSIKVDPSAPMVLGYYVPGAAALADLKSHVQQITAIAPFWYSLRINGTLHDLGSSVNLTRWCVAHKIAVYPMVINGYGNTNILQNPAYYARDLADLVRLAQTSGYAGLNIDFESLNNDDEGLLDRFVAALADGLHQEGKKLIVSVGPRTSNRNGYHVYNYGSLGSSANYVDLMLYDEHDNTSAAGPVAGLKWADAIMQYARATIPAAKILVGLAGYGYNWASSGSTTVTDAQALSLVNRYGYEWDGGSVQEPEVTYSVGGVPHTVWFEDSYSEAFKVRWVREYHLGGVALWALGEENRGVWPMLHAMLP